MQRSHLARLAQSIAGRKGLAFTPVIADHSALMPSRPVARRYAVIMAGGFGTRFWPRSRRDLPKQFLCLTGRQTMLQQTVSRLAGVVPVSRIFVVAGPEFARRIRLQLPQLPLRNLIIEPAPRGTAACLAVAAERIASLDPTAAMAVFPADHVITDPVGFRAAVARAFSVAERDGSLVTFGIQPTHPETGYGYIERAQLLARQRPRVYAVARFHEKPDRQTARRYLAAGRFLWNAGIFLWRVDVISALFARFAPETGTVARDLVQAKRPAAAAAAKRRYHRLPPVSVDVAILERAEQLAVIEGNFGWSDVGSWAAMSDLWGTDRSGNASRGPALIVGSRDVVVYGEERLIALVGVEDLVVVDSDDAVLVCRKSEAQDVRAVVDALKRSRYRTLL